MPISFTKLSGRVSPMLPLIGVFVAATIALLLVLIPLGAFSAEFSAPDEAAHLVSGIMVYQYLIHGLPNGVGPLAFAQDYYDHYPKVAIGHWPPIFYCVEAIWFLFAGLSRASVMILAAVIGGLLATLTAWFCRLHNLGWPIAVSAAIVAVLSPQTIISTLEFSSDPLTAVFVLIAAVFCQRWLENLDLNWGIAFALMASAAALVKGNAFPLFLLPALILFRPSPFRSMMKPAFWLPILIMIGLTLPWYAYQRELAVAEIVPGGTNSLPRRMVGSSRANSFRIPQLAGPLLSILALLSLIPSIGGKWAVRSFVLAALPVAFWFFLSFLSPHGELRLMLALTPVICLAAAITLSRLPAAIGCFILFTGLALNHYLLPVLSKPVDGWIPAVASIRAAPPQTYFIGSNHLGEGGVISELALFEPQPRRTVLRASKLLIQSNWMGTSVRNLVQTPEEVQAILLKHQVDSVLLEINPRRQVSAPLQLLIEATSHWPVQAKFNNIKILARPH